MNIVQSKVHLEGNFEYKKMSQLHKDISLYTIPKWFHLKSVPFTRWPLYDAHGKHFGSFGVIRIMNFKWHYEVLRVALEHNFWVVMTIYNSPYFYVVSVIEQVAWIAIYYNMSQFNATQLELYQNNPFSTTM
jgi:hypothetical protein